MNNKKMGNLWHANKNERKWHSPSTLEVEGVSLDF